MRNLKLDSAVAAGMVSRVSAGRSPLQWEQHLRSRASPSRRVLACIQLRKNSTMNSEHQQRFLDHLRPPAAPSLLRLVLFLYGVLPVFWTQDLCAAVLEVPGQFGTVQDAMRAAQPGDTVRLSPGHYDVTVSSVRSGGANLPITLDGQLHASVRQVSLTHSNIHVQNLTIRGITNAGGILLYLNQGAHHCVISNNVMDAQMSTVYGISWHLGSIRPFDDNAASYNLIISNTITGTRGTTMLNIGGTANVIKGNRVVDCVMADFIRLWGRSNHIVANVFSNNMYAAGIGNHADFIQTFGGNGNGSMGHLIEGNLVARIEAGQLTQLSNGLLPTIRDWTFFNNVFVDIAMQASCTMPEVKYYNNVFYRCNNVNGGHVLSFGYRYISSTTSYYGEEGTNYAHGAQVINNVFLNCGNGTVSKGWYSIDRSLTNVIADHNFVAILDTQPVTVDSEQLPVGDPGGWWNSFKWWEPNGINGGNPLFVNQAGLNFRLREGSPLIGKGMPLNNLFTTDMLGVTRGAQWDIGAFEFEAGQAVLQPVAPSGFRVVRQ